MSPRVDLLFRLGSFMFAVKGVSTHEELPIRYEKCAWCIA
jgi:hypothetical protein